ncbi:metal dependent phosphohydrolase [Sulfurimonas gotlandica GD1]|uniref:Metal dependent phosphohydrolase n=2 Tax=Sulfurimonas TaxID=202746 RepID=H1FYT7_SULGG|nr:metal dependent phosphohydrolase [Sulfurimonas gotlandica GD1]
MLIIAAVIGLSYRSFFEFVIEKKIISVSEIVKAGLTSHMKAGIMDKRSYFLNEISSVYDIKSIKIIRGDSVNKQYGESTLYEKKLTPSLREILEKKEVFVLYDDMESSIEAVVPYIASSDGTLNCLECHNAKDGEVLGAVDITMDIGSYQVSALKNSYIIGAVLLFLALVIILNMFRVIERYIREPLSHIIEDGELAYKSHKVIDSSKYESREFEDVVKNVNKFNFNILEKEEELLVKNIQLQNLNDEIESTLKETMLAVGRIEEIRSKETRLHTKRVSIISTLVAREYGLSEEEVNLIELASPLHDIGKVGISDAILNKPEKLTDEEYNIMKSHSILGLEILNHSERKLLQTAAIIAYEHHEKYDGTGYPQGLVGEEISIYARIVAIVDVFDALLSKRAYKEKWALEDVIEQLKEESGKHFDPKLVDIIITNKDEYKKILRELS